jgi:aspartate 1-decarboxylase
VREFLRSKIHHAVITKADLEYEGSLGIDAELLKRAEILPFEAVEIYNVTNGQRVRTYAIELPAGSRRIESNGAAAHLIRQGDQVIIATYLYLNESEIAQHQPKILILHPDNSLKKEYRAQL